MIHTHTHKICHTLTDTKTSETLDKLLARKSIEHSKLFGGEKGARKDRRYGRKRNRGCQPSTGDKERVRGVKNRIHPRLVPVLFALIAPRYNSTFSGDPPELPPTADMFVRISDGLYQLRLSRSGERQCGGNEKQEGPGSC